MNESNGWVRMPAHWTAGFWERQTTLWPHLMRRVIRHGGLGADPVELKAILDELESNPVPAMAYSMMPFDIMADNGAWEFVPTYLEAAQVPMPVEDAILSLRGLQRVRFLVKVCRTNGVKIMRCGGKRWAILPTGAVDVRSQLL